MADCATETERETEDETLLNKGYKKKLVTAILCMGCPCHLNHNTACRGSEALDAVGTFNVEEFCIDMFDKSTKRKSMLEHFCSFYDVTYKQIVKQVNTRWLSLETAIRRNLAGCI